MPQHSIDFASTTRGHSLCEPMRGAAPSSWSSQTHDERPDAAVGTTNTTTRKHVLMGMLGGRQIGKVSDQTFPPSQLFNSSRVHGGPPTNQWMGRAEVAHIEFRSILHLVSFCLTLIEHVLLTSPFVWLDRKRMDRNAPVLLSSLLHSCSLSQGPRLLSKTAIYLSPMASLPGLSRSSTLALLLCLHN